jgi:hypothetical protein
MVGLPITNKFTALKLCFTAYADSIRHQVLFFGTRMCKCEYVVIIVKLVLFLTYSEIPGIFHKNREHFVHVIAAATP